MHPTRATLLLPAVVLAGIVLVPTASAQDGVVEKKPVLQDAETKKPAAKQGASVEDKRALVEALFEGKQENVIKAMRKARDAAFVGAVSATAAKVIEANPGGGADDVGDDVKAKVKEALIKSLVSGDLQGLPADAGAAVGELMAGFRKNLDNLRVMLVRQVILAGLASRAVYAGQYTILKSLGADAHLLMVKMIDNPPTGVDDSQRQALIGALRDVTDKLSDEHLKLLGEIADDDFEDPQVQSKAIHVLAFYGDRKRLAKSIANFETTAKSESDQERLQALVNLATLYHDIRDYKKAVECYKRLFEKLPDGIPNQALATTYYNMCCSQTLSGDLDGAFKSLDKALELDTGQLADSTLKTDHDINGLRKDPRFKALLEKHDRLQKKSAGDTGK